jgi:heme o synthase
MSVKAYYELAKPGIVYGNTLTVVGGFFLANQVFQPLVFLSTLFGICLVMACGCVLNNYLDRDIDILMGRTKKRPLVTGTISVRNALVYAAILGCVGTGLLLLANVLAAVLGLIGLFFYVVVYGYAKRRTIHGTLVGSISGAIPILVGYCAARNSFDTGALLVFVLMVFWQMAHFFSIAMYRLHDYEAAHIPVLPSIRGMKAARAFILGYVIAFTLTVASPTAFHYTGYLYGVIMVVIGLAWLVIGLRGYASLPDARWGRGMFRFSLIVISVFSLMLAIGPHLP